LKYLLHVPCLKVESLNRGQSLGNQESLEKGFDESRWKWTVVARLESPEKGLVALDIQGMRGVDLVEHLE
jgi:hypothetical protein